MHCSKKNITGPQKEEDECAVTTRTLLRPNKNIAAPQQGEVYCVLTTILLRRNEEKFTAS